MSSLEQPEQQPTPSPNDNAGPDGTEAVIAEDTLSVRRSPRYKNFMIVGAAVGVVSTFVLTVAFPDTAEFSKAQIFGFLLLACLAAGVLLGAVTALVFDRAVGRRTHTVVADRLARDDSRATPATDQSPDTRYFTEKPE